MTTCPHVAGPRWYSIPSGWNLSAIVARKPVHSFHHYITTFLLGLEELYAPSRQFVNVRCIVTHPKKCKINFQKNNIAHPPPENPFESPPLASKDPFGIIVIAALHLMLRKHPLRPPLWAPGL